MKAIILISVLLTFVHQCVSVGNERVFLSSQRTTKDFCYGEEPCGPANWPGKCKNGTRQSPINISPVLNGPLRPAFAPISSFAAPSFSMWNNGHSIVVSFIPTDRNQVSEIFPGYGLSTRQYRFDNGHFHWGKSSNGGSEHLINSRGYSMELHLVHFDARFDSVQEALESSYPQALAVVGIFFQVDAAAPPSEALRPIVTQLRIHSEEKRFQSVSTEPFVINEEIDWTSIIPTRHSLPARVFNYQGSLTTPNCSEQVDWFVYAKPSWISESDVEAFRTIIGNGGRPLVENNRPVLPLNNRRVTTLIA